MKSGLLSFIFFFISFQQLSAQKYVLIEKAGNPRTERIPMYQELTFQIRDDKVGWYTRQILDMDPDGQMILLGDSWVALNTIASIKLNRKRVWPNIIGGALQVGGISMFMGDLWFTVSDQPQYSEGGMEFGLLNFAVGTIIRTFFSPIIYDLGKRKRLRVVDLTF
ncbi:MAG: hypothetical protein SH808_11635 [Saprospiraceae bacterium]|nr:hypothetical protein [Saprospiraceae bacterium]